MKTKLPYQESSLLHLIIDFTKKSKFCIVFVYLFLSNVSVSAQESNLFSPLAVVENVVPNAYATTNGGNSFLGPFSNSQRTYQMLIAASELTNIAGKNLMSISFRNSGTVSTEWPATSTTYNNYDIYLSGSVNPVDRSFVFAQNVVGTQTQVRSGDLIIPAGSLTIGSNPNNFSFDIEFDTPWFYSGGNLLVEIRHDGFSGTSRSVDAAGTSTSGYGSLYSACWGSSYTAVSTTTQGNFVIVNFKADDALSVDEFKENELKVYPNPTSDLLYIDSELELSNIKIVNMLGQMVYSEELNNQKSSISLSQLNSGTYLLHLETEYGVQVKKIVKE
jgi:hypothetical protein